MAGRDEYAITNRRRVPVGEVRSFFRTTSDQEKFDLVLQDFRGSFLPLAPMWCRVTANNTSYVEVEMHDGCHRILTRRVKNYLKCFQRVIQDGGCLEDYYEEYDRVEHNSRWEDLIPLEFIGPQGVANGQAKIFCACARVFVDCDLDELRIVVVGSKSSFMGGKSYANLAQLLSLAGKRGTMTLYDAFENDQDIDYGSFKLEKRNGYFTYVNDGKYTHILDDSYVSGLAPPKYVPGTVMSCKSDLAVKVGDGFVVEDQPYYLGQETRQIWGARPRRPPMFVQGMCSCRNCRVAGSCLNLNGDAKIVEFGFGCLVRMGVRPCSSYPGARMFNLMSDVESAVNLKTVLKLQAAPCSPKYRAEVVSRLVDQNKISASSDFLTLPREKPQGKFRSKWGKLYLPPWSPELRSDSLDAHVVGRIAIVGYMPSEFGFHPSRIETATAAYTVIAPSARILNEVSPDIFLIPNTERTIVGYEKKCVVDHPVAVFAVFHKDVLTDRGVRDLSMVYLDSETNEQFAKMLSDSDLIEVNANINIMKCASMMSEAAFLDLKSHLVSEHNRRIVAFYNCDEPPDMVEMSDEMVRMMSVAKLRSYVLDHEKSAAIGVNSPTLTRVKKELSKRDAGL